MAPENKIQEELAINDIHTSLDLGSYYIEGNTTLEVLLTSGETKVEEVELREEEAWKEDTGLDQNLRQEPPEPVGSSTPRYSAETKGEYVEDAENMLVTKEEMLEADTLEVEEAKASALALGETKSEP